MYGEQYEEYAYWCSGVTQQIKESVKLTGAWWCLTGDGWRVSSAAGCPGKQFARVSHSKDLKHVLKKSL